MVEIYKHTSLEDGGMVPSTELEKRPNKIMSEHIHGDIVSTLGIIIALAQADETKRKNLIFEITEAVRNIAKNTNGWVAQKNPSGEITPLRAEELTNMILAENPLGDEILDPYLKTARDLQKDS